MSARKASTRLVTVKAVHPYQISYEGKVAGPGETLDVPPELAERWAATGLVES